MKVSKRITIKGIVQGVGFRPFIYRLAFRHSINGTVSNNSSGVIVEAEGTEKSLANFLKDIKLKAPRGAKIKEIICESAPTRHFNSFKIVPSRKEEKREAFIPPDIATCGDCIKELLDKRDRRFRYPFINCTNCGPRYTIIKDIPYDRPATTMNKFVMCDSCENEYLDPLNRRFHAQPNACPNCGPSIELLDSEGNKLHVAEPISFVSRKLKEGALLALKGLGGFHLTCDARNDRAVERIRSIKKRRDKPLAVMVPDMETATELAFLEKKDKEILNSCESPIVLAKKKENSSISPLIAPYLDEIGIMLPYTPLHHLLLKEFKGPLVMTSGNPSGTPILHKNEDALKLFRSLVDYFLLHNRDIHIRIDDSVIRIIQSTPMILRRARGYTPSLMDLGFKSKTTVLALGGMLKATFTFVRDDKAIVSQYFGDLSNPDNLNFYMEVLEHIRKLYGFKPDCVVCDLHPDYPTTILAEQISAELNCRLIKVQHHIAHLMSAAAEHNFYEDFIGVALDGTGYGLDGNIWGGEIFWGKEDKLKRIAHIDYFWLPTGDKGIEEPWRIAFSLLFNVLGDKALESNWIAIRRKSIPVNDFLKVLALSKHPLTSSSGRLLDAVASLLNIRDKITYEAQAAIELETLADKHEEGFYYTPISNLNLNPYHLIEEILLEQNRGVAAHKISARVHNTLARWILNVAQKIRDEKGINHVVLSGGVFQNRYLLLNTLKLLKENGFRVIFNSTIPINDSGISFGQAVIGALRSRE